MKNFKNLFSIFIVLSILSTNIAIFPLPVLAFDKGGFYFKQSESSSLSRIKTENQSITEEFLTKKNADKRLGVGESKGKINILESLKQEGREGKNYVEGEVLVKYKKNKINLETFLGRAAAESFSRAKSMEKKEDLKRINVSVLKIKDGKTVEEKIAELKNDPNIEYIEPNYIYPWTSIPNDSNFSELWGLHNTGQTVNEVVGTPNADINAPEAWDIFTGSNSTIIAVLDTGIAYNHPDLVDNMWDGSIDCKDENNQSISCPYHGWDYVNNDFDPVDDYGHGTHVAGSIGGKGNNNRGVVGVNWDIKLMALKVGDYQGAISGDVIKAIEFAINNGVKIINASFSGDSSSSINYEAINDFRNSGGIFITSAGNESNNNDAGVHYYPCDYDLDNIICVAATDQDDNLTSWSNYGTTSVDVGAPGVNIYSVIAKSTVLNETFESVITPHVPSGWVKTHNWGTHDLGDPVGKVLYGDYLNIPYENNINSTITLPDLDLSGAGKATINFLARCDTEYWANWYDYMALEISSDGSSFSEWFRFDEVLLDLLNGESPLDSSGGAVYYFQELIPADYLTNNFKLRFRWFTDFSNVPDIDYDGCWIDDVLITKYTDGSDEEYGYMQGTSMATPHVAGLAGLIWGYKPELTYSQVKDIILSTGDDKPSLSGKTVTGKRINAFNALNSLIDTTPPILTEVIPVATSTNDTTPNYTFNSNEAGTISYSGGCTSSTTEAVAGDNIISFNELTDGTYASCAITVTDISNNTSDPLLISPFTVDTVIPIITLTGSSTINLYVGDLYTDQGATATDDFDGDITVNIVVGGDTVDTSTVGTYVITYNVSDTAGNPAEEVTRTVIVSETPDNTPPTLAEVAPVLTPTNDNTPDYTFNSDEAGTISYEGGCISTTTEALVGDNTITFNSLADGTYDSCTITVTDEAGNPSDPLAVTEFIIDTVPPVITLIGSSTVDIYVGNTYEDEGATATDNIDSDITGNIITNNPVDINIVGTYLVTYNVTDAAGNSAEQVTRTVNVNELPDTTPPVLTEITPVPSPTNDNTPDYTFNTNEAGTISYFGGCSSETAEAIEEENAITFNELADGTYSDCSIIVTDASGNPSDPLIISEFTIDTIAPIITLLGDDPVNIEVSTVYSDAGATAEDNNDGDITGNIITVNPVDGNVVGSYVVTYNVTDSAGNTALEVTREVNVIDTTAPVITLLGDNEITIEVGSSYSDAGAEANDNYDGDITDNIVTVNPVDTNLLGTYIITYNVTDSLDNPAEEVTRTVHVVDTTAPIITILGDNPVTLEVGSVYTDAGATASDNYDGDITDEIITTNTVNQNTIGTYTVTYNVTDSSGNPAIQVIRTVNVVDTTAPVITLLGENPVNLFVGETYTDAGATALDNIDGNITANIIVVNPVNVNVVGTYVITYNVSDAAGNPAQEVTRTVHVLPIPDTTAPVITLLGSNPITIEVGTVYTDAGATASDDVDGDITANIVIVNPVNSSVVGTYTVTYNVKDSSDNPAPEVTRTVNVVDTTVPIITLIGDNPVNAEVGYEYNDAGATASDNHDGNITGNMVIVNPVNSNTIGIYTVTYNVTDSSGNPATEVTRTVNVVDTTPPVITLLGENPITIPVNTVYDDAGATASDNYDGVITNNIVTVNSVDTNTIGTYYVTYNVTDSSSNPAIEVIRTVNVIDVSTPIISLLGNNPLTIEVGSVYSDAGATATDDVDGDISGNIVVVNNVNSNILGTYTVTYNVSDSSGNHAAEAIRTVNVVDTTAPVIVLLGDNPASVEVGYEYNDAGATANDNYDGDITDSIVTVNPVDYNTVGTYTVTYNVTDSSGNSADEVTRTVIISVDTTPPTITGLSDDTIPKKSKTWNWDSDDSLAKFRFIIDQSDISILSGEYSTIKTTSQSTGDGIYYLHVQAKDNTGNESEVVTVSAILDNTPPIAVLSGLPSDLTTETTANITVGGQDVVYYKYKLDSGNYSDEIATTTPITLSGLSTDLHVIYVMGRDIVGNWQTEENKTSYSWTITGGGGGGGGGGGSYTPPPVSIKGDINKDNKVDKYDFSMMMAAWGKTGSNTSDLNGDNKVDKYDFALLMSKWSIM